MEVFHNEDDSYLRSVHSLVDKNAKDYLNSVCINKNVLPERIEIKSRDSAGYVTEILADGESVGRRGIQKRNGTHVLKFYNSEVWKGNTIFM